jgi:hypothetical protein
MPPDAAIAAIDTPMIFFAIADDAYADADAITPMLIFRRFSMLAIDAMMPLVYLSAG